METNELKYYLFASIISAENNEFTEEDKQEVIRRYDLEDDVEFDKKDWEFILEPVDNTGKITKLFM